MAEYIEKQKIKEQLQLESDCRMIITLQDIFDIIDFFPATDVVSVVRCKDCVYSHKVANEMGEIYYNCNNNDYGIYGFEMRNNDFCSYGERRLE